MNHAGKAETITLTDFHSVPMRAFHMTWFAFFLCFFAWFGIAPLMPMVRDEMGLKPWQMGNLIIASVAATVISRLLIGWLCDRIGPRWSYAWLLCLGSLPVMGIGLAQNYEQLFWFRFAIGAIGASFVITQFHTSMMFAPTIVGTANATTAGWGNLGGGVTQQAMPIIASFVVWTGASSYLGWRIAMLIAGAVCFATGVAYLILTQDTPEGNFSDLKRGRDRQSAGLGGFLSAVRDARVWALFGCYAACFGVELTINNIAATYFYDRFALSLETAGIIAGLFGLMNLFARTLGGYWGDVFGVRWGLSGRVRWLFVTLFLEGIALVVFSQMTGLLVAVAAMVVFSLFVQMSEGATFSVVPFVNRRALGCVAGIVGAGGNVGAVGAGFLFKTETAWWPTALLIMGGAVTVCAFLALAVRFSPAAEHEARTDVEGAVAGSAGALAGA